MSKKTQADVDTPVDSDGADTLRQQPQSGTPGGNERAQLSGAEEPHERDESPASEITGQSSVDPRRDDIEQASEDIERGLVDTDRRGTPNDIPDQEPLQDATRSSTSRP